MLIGDTSGTITPGVASALKGGGFDGVIRYASRVSGPEIAAARSAGLDFGLVHETSGTSGENGGGTGAAEATYLCDRAGVLGAAKGVILYLGAFDFDYRNPAGAQSYIDGAMGVFRAAGFLGGFYGSAGLGENTHGWDAWWQCMSSGFWANGSPWPRAALHQRFPQPVFGGVQFDTNDTQLPAWGGWFSATPPAPVPPPPTSPALTLLGG